MPVQEWVLTSAGWRNPLSPEPMTCGDFLVYGQYEPDASTTGPVGSLTPHSGSITTSEHGQVIENDGCF